MLHFESIERQVFMISKNLNVRTKEHTSKFFESYDDGKHFFFHGSIVFAEILSAYVRSRQPDFLLE